VKDPKGSVVEVGTVTLGKSISSLGIFVKKFGRDGNLEERDAVHIGGCKK
jgi:hypothetical protein